MNGFHMLWDIPFNDDAQTIQKKLIEKTGVYAEYSERINPLGFETYTVELASDPNNTRFGHPYELEYLATGLNPSSSLWTKTFYMYFLSKDDDTPKVRFAQCKDVINGMIGEYGIPNAASIEMHNYGFGKRNDESIELVHEVIDLDTSKIRNLDIQNIVNNWNYATDSTTVNLRVYFGNILCTAYYDFGASYQLTDPINVIYYLEPQVPIEIVFERNNITE